MPLPIKSRYTIAEAAKFIATATGETVTQAQILDWGTQGFYRLHLAIERYSIRADGTTEIIQIRDSIIELRLTGGQAAILGRGERVGISECWHNGAACKFMRQRTGDYSGWTPNTVYFGAAALVVIGAELDAFTASIAEPRQTAPATETATPAPVVADSASTTPDPERRLARLRELGGNATYKHGEWSVTGISALVASEKSEGRKRSAEKTIRADLKEAAENEREAKRANAFSGLGQK